MSLDNENEYGHLEELGGSDYEIVDGQPNIIGWDVKNEQGQKIGEVEELLFSTESRKVRYLVVDLDGNDFDLEDDHNILVPIGVAELHENDDDVIVPNVTAAQLSALPAYEKGLVSPETETSVRDIFLGTGVASAITPAVYNDDFYNHDHFNETKFYGTRATNASDLTPPADDTLPVNSSGTFEKDPDSTAETKVWVVTEDDGLNKDTKGWDEKRGLSDDDDAGRIDPNRRTDLP
jgi:sporulation protein YlmC with PRC-barrel domain